MEDLTGVGEGEASAYEAGASECPLPRGEGDTPDPKVGWMGRVGEGVADVLRVRYVDGDAFRRPDALGDGDEKTSSFSTGKDLGLACVGLSLARAAPSLERPPDGTRRKGDLLTYSLRARPLSPMLCRGTRLPDRMSGLSFSLLPETTRSPEALLSPPPATAGKATFVRSAETRLVPDTADPLAPPPLADRDVERGLAVADMPNPILAFAVDATPEAVTGASPIALLPPPRSCMTLSSAEVSPADPLDCLKGELETREFFVTCLKLELVRRGEASSPLFGDPIPSDIFGDGLRGDSSLLAIFKGDQP